MYDCNENKNIILFYVYSEGFDMIVNLVFFSPILITPNIYIKIFRYLLRTMPKVNLSEEKLKVRSRKNIVSLGYNVAIWILDLISIIMVRSSVSDVNKCK